MDEKRSDRPYEKPLNASYRPLFLDRFLPLQLSGGQQNVTAMARALVKDSQLFCSMKPLVNLD